MAAYLKSATLCFAISIYGRRNDTSWSLEKVITKKEIFEILTKVYEIESTEQHYFGEVAKRYRYIDNGAEVGFITSVSESFCSSCTRARLSSDGKFFTCLFASEGFDLRELIRSGLADSELLSAISGVWERRTDRYSDERSEQTGKNRTKIGMSYIGG